MDSITALWLLTQTKEGRKKYPGIEDATWEFWCTGTICPNGKTADQYLSEGTLLVGVGGSKYDEHARAGFDGKSEGLSATMLVAKDLGFHESRLYRTIVKAVTEADLSPVGSIDAVSRIVKLMHRMPDSDPFRVISWAFAAIEAMVGSQQDFEDAMVQLKDVVLKRVEGLTEAWCTCVSSNNPQMWAAARYRNPKLAILIQVGRLGHVQIFGNQKLGVKMSSIAGAIRQEELVVRGFDSVADKNRGRLESPGQLDFVPNWCLQIPGENLLQGSETAPDCEPTRIPIQRIKQIVLENLCFGEVSTKD